MQSQSTHADITTVSDDDYMSQSTTTDDYHYADPHALTCPVRWVGLRP